MMHFYAMVIGIFVNNVADFGGSLAPFTLTSPPLTQSQHAAVIKRLDAQLQRIQQKPGRLSVINLFSFALMCAEANLWWDRLDEVFAIAEEMQDRDPNSSTFGNFRWYFETKTIEDLNAVEFSMQDATLLWIRHSERLPKESKGRLLRLMQYGAEGVKRHRVPVSYTNIYLKKTWNCISLGMCLKDERLLNIGLSMLDTWLLYTWENGISEYLSPTYYGVNLDPLVLIARFSPSKAAREKAMSALSYVWMDIAANWFEPNKRLGGAHSRDYDYLTGRGYLDEHLRFAGWLDAPEDWVAPVHLLIAGLKPPENLRKFAAYNRPRFVYQRWGSDKEAHWASHYNGQKISIGVAGACYGPEDKVLTFQFANGINSPMGYYVLDARDDPYGKKREITPGGHPKSWHPVPFVTSVRYEKEVLFLASIDPSEPNFRRWIPNPKSLCSHFVIPKDGVEIWVGESILDLVHRVGEANIPLGTPIVIRYKDAAIGIRIIYAVDLEGNPAKISLINDGNKYGVVRLTVVHSPGEPKKGIASIVAWLRAEEGLDDGSFFQFLREFSGRIAYVQADLDKGLIEAIVKGGKVLCIKADVRAKRRLLREGDLHLGKDCLLCVDEKDVGRELLQSAEKIAILQKMQLGDCETAKVNEPFEAEEAPIILAPFEVGEDEAALGRKFVWVCGELGGKGSFPEARLLIPVRIEKAGLYFVHARVLTPTPNDDSFFIRVTQGKNVLLPLTEWHTGIHKNWGWTTLQDKDGKPLAINLPKGIIIVEISCREDGAKLDCIMISTSHFQAAGNSLAE